MEIHLSIGEYDKEIKVQANKEVSASTERKKAHCKKTQE